MASACGARTHTHAHIHARMKVISRKQVRACFKKLEVATTLLVETNNTEAFYPYYPNYFQDIFL